MVSAAVQPAPKYGWRPNPGSPQEFALSIRGVRELMFGGARGGSKTETGIMWMARPRYTNNPRYRGLVVRQQYKDLCDWIDRAEARYIPMGAKILRSSPVSFHWPSGAIIRTGHLNNASAYTNFQGHEYQLMLFEEITQIPNERLYKMVIQSCRTTVPGLDACVFLTANPGGVGHRWVVNRFKILSHKPRHAYPISDVNHRLMMFVPSRVEDTPQLMETDPDYVASLRDLPEQLRRAWYEGDWSAFENQMFDFGDAHILPDDVDPPAGADVLMTFDYGFGKPWSAGYWFTRGSGENAQLVRFGEIYGARPGGEDKGLRLDDASLAEMLLAGEARFGINDSHGIVRLAGRDLFSQRPDYFNRAGGGQGPSVAEGLARHGLVFKPGDDRSRIAKIRQFHNYLHIRRDDAGNVVRPPRLLVAPRCVDFIRTIPVLVPSESDPEDVDTRAEDHIYDEACHAVMYRWPGVTRDASAAGPSAGGSSSWARSGQNWNSGDLQ